MCKFLVSASFGDMITLALKMTKNDIGDTWIDQFISVQTTATTTLKVQLEPLMNFAVETHFKIGIVTLL